MATGFQQALAVTAVVALGAVWPSRLLAQSDSVSSPRPDSLRAPHVCWGGRPRPQCSTFWVTEMSFEYPFAKTSTRFVENFGGGEYRYTISDFRSRLVWTVGPMVNISANRAIGGTLSVGTAPSGLRAALEARRRWWGADGIAYDLSAGVLRVDLPAVPGNLDHKGYGLTAGAFLIGNDLIQLNTHADVVMAAGRLHAAGSVGMGLGSKAAAAGTVLLGALVIVALTAIARSGDF